jgi:hypothetical protein
MLSKPTLCFFRQDLAREGPTYPSAALSEAERGVQPVFEAWWLDVAIVRVGVRDAAGGPVEAANVGWPDGLWLLHAGIHGVMSVGGRMCGRMGRCRAS